ncbi:hypothetical protein B0H12DRAFT_662061 [Mycena haematopus]|nr:hypothetical protein B0H12DRAFT_662061 [Mycena haematopus]
MEQWDYPQINLAYAAPGASYDQLLTQFYQQQSQQARLYPTGPPVQLTGRCGLNFIHNPHRNTTAAASDAFPPATSTVLGPQRRSTVEIPTPSPQSAAYSDNRSPGSDFCFSFSGGPRLNTCTTCRKIHTKCVFDPDADICRRCRTGGHVCIIAQRKPRSRGKNARYLLAQIQEKDRVIESLLKQLQNRYISPPLSFTSYRMATSPSDTKNPAIQSGSEARVRTCAFPKSTNSCLPSNNALLEWPAEGMDSESDVLCAASVPLGLMALIANLSLSDSWSWGHEGVGEEEPDDQDEDNIGVANVEPGPSTDLGNSRSS